MMVHDNREMSRSVFLPQGPVVTCSGFFSPCVGSGLDFSGFRGGEATSTALAAHYQLAQKSRLSRSTAFLGDLTISVKCHDES